MWTAGEQWTKAGAAADVVMAFQWFCLKSLIFPDLGFSQAGLGFMDY